MKKLLLAGTALAALAAGSANAADLARPVPVYRAPPPVVSYFTWTGCYVGGNGGGLWARKDWSNDVAIPAWGHFLPFLQGGASAHTMSTAGLAVFRAAAITRSATGCSASRATMIGAVRPGSNNNVLFPFVAQSNIRSLASVTGRVGYAWDRFLLYAKGGGAWARDEYSMTANVLIPGFTIATASETRSGWTVGIGGEYAFLDWLTGFVEYDYYGFGTNQNTFGPCGALVCGAAATLPVDVKENVNVFKAGLELPSSARRLRWWANTDRPLSHSLRMEELRQRRELFLLWFADVSGRALAKGKRKPFLASRPRPCPAPAPIGELHADLAGAVHHVVVGEDVAVGVDHEPGAEAARIRRWLRPGASQPGSPRPGTHA